MCKTQNDQKTKPKPDDYAKRLTGTALFTSSVARQNDIILLPTIKILLLSATPVFALNSATCSGIPLCLATLFTSCH
jgi:hypothetical protein